MEAIIVIFLLILVVMLYGFMIMLFFALLGIGCMIAFPVGVYIAIKNYMSSIRENINSKWLRITMMIITPMFIVFILLLMFI